MSACPLCQSSHRQELGAVAINDLANAYQQQLQIQVTLPEIDVPLRLWRCENCDLRYYDPMTTGDEKFYEALQPFDWYYLADKEEYVVAARYIDEHDQVLEIGSGRAAFAKKIRCDSYLGLEFSSSAIRMATEQGIQLVGETVQAHAVKHPEQYDVVCSFQVLEHVSDIRGFIEASVACLKPGGLLIYSVPNEDGLPGVEINNVLNMPPHHVSRWTKTCMRNVAREFGLTVLAMEEEKVSDLHVDAASRTFAQHAFGKFFGWSPRLLDARYNRRPVRHLVNRLARFLKGPLQDERLRPTGHSLTCVFQK